MAAAPTKPPAPDNQTLPARIRRLTGWSLYRLAQELGAAESTVRGWESGQRHPSGAARKAMESMLDKITCAPTPPTPPLA